MDANHHQNSINNVKTNPHNVDSSEFHIPQGIHFTCSLMKFTSSQGAGFIEILSSLADEFAHTVSPLLYMTD